MAYLLKNGQVYMDRQIVKADICVDNGHIVSISPEMDSSSGDFFMIDCSDKLIVPGLIDVHVHLREPGFLYKEDVETGTRAAARGGYTCVCAMPNLNPVPDSMETLQLELDAIEEKALIYVSPYGAITKGEKGEELADLEAMAPYVIGFSDDGRGVQDEEMMRVAMKRAKALGMPIVAHCEDNSLLHGGYIHDGEYAKVHGHRGICSESEWGPIARDVELVKEIGVDYHVCHVSAKESVEVIRKAKAAGVNITCETGPHYLTMNDSMLQEDGRFKMNPPIRGEEDRLALIEGIKDGTVDMIATDHAPHSAEEKSKGLEKSMMGVVGLETAFAKCYTELVKKDVITLEKLIELMHDNPKKRFGLGTEIAEGEPADLAVFDLNRKYVIDPETFMTKGRSTPFAGDEVYGDCVLTMVDGEIVWMAAFMGRW